jgi:hypothetical protein
MIINLKGKQSQEEKSENNTRYLLTRLDFFDDIKRSTKLSKN